MIVKWHCDPVLHMNKTSLVKIYTGETQQVSNWQAALSAQGKVDTWQQAWGAIVAIATNGRDLVANQPEVDTFEVEGRKLACVYGVIQKGITPRGRVEGDYKFVFCAESEVLLVLAKVFNLQRRLERGA
jgi:hypothetical protein